MKLSAFLDSIELHAQAAAIRGTKKDIDTCEYLGESVAALESGARESIRGLAGRAYSTGDINTPRMAGFAVDYQDGSNYLADLVCPMVPGDIKRRYTKFSRRDGSRALDLRVDPKGQPKEASIDISNGTYLEQGYAEIQKISNKDIADAGDIPRLFMKHSVALMGDLKRAREIRVANMFMTAGNYAAGCTSALSGFNRWDVGPTTSTANPLNDIRITARINVNVAGTPNAGACSLPVAETLRVHPKIVAAAGAHASDRVVSFDELRSLLNLQYLFIGDAKIDTAGNAAAAAYSYLWGKGFSLFQLQPGASDDDPSFAKTFEHLPTTFTQSTDNVPGTRGVTIIKGAQELAEIVVAADRAYLLDTVIS